MAKKAKGKGKGKGKNAGKAEEIRLAALRVLEDEAEEIQRRENDRREREEQDERISLAREEQLRLIREKERRIEELGIKVTEVCDTLRDDRFSYESQIAQLSVLRDSLFNEVSLLKAEMDERQQLFSRERENMVMRSEKLRTDTDTMRVVHEQEKVTLREQLYVATSIVEEQRTQLDTVKEEKQSNDREFLMKIKALERELEKALTINRTLQTAVEEREADDKKNLTLMQLLNAQLDESRRHFEEQLEDERQRTCRTKEEVLQLETRRANLQEELDVLKTEHADGKQRASAELREYQQQLEQMKFDAEYLNSEIDSMRAQCTEAVRDAENAKAVAEAEAKNCLVEMEGLQKKADDLEALLFRKEREHFDKVTFLNAQISNNRTAVSQLQQRLADERVGYERELERCTADMHRTAGEITRMGDLDTQRAKERKEHEERLLSDISILKTTVFQLQAALEEKERGFGLLCQSKNEELKRLQDILDAHFIPHRKDVEVSRMSEAVDEAANLRITLKEVQHEASLKEQAFMETEIWMKSRIANQAEVIDQLQHDLRKAEALRQEEVHALKDEVARLKKAMDIHFIPYPV